MLNSQAQCCQLGLAVVGIVPGLMMMMIWFSRCTSIVPGVTLDLSFKALLLTFSFMAQNKVCLGFKMKIRLCRLLR